jgi:hypothetical protein
VLIVWKGLCDAPSANVNQTLDASIFSLPFATAGRTGENHTQGGEFVRKHMDEGKHRNEDAVGDEGKEAPGAPLLERTARSMPRGALEASDVDRSGAAREEAPPAVCELREL